MAKAATAKKAAPKTAKKAAPKTDKAQRPVPADRDGDGKPGGSLPGNQTVPQAKGSDDSALARQEIAADGTATIILKSVSIGRKKSHPLLVNGRKRDLATNVQVQVNAAELEALERSHIEYETVIPLATAGTAAVEGSSAAVETPPAPEAPAEGGEGGAPTDETQPEGGEGAAPVVEGTDAGNGDGATA